VKLWYDSKSLIVYCFNLENKSQHVDFGSRLLLQMIFVDLRMGIGKLNTLQFNFVTTVYKILKSDCILNSHPVWSTLAVYSTMCLSADIILKANLVQYEVWLNFLLVLG